MAQDEDSLMEECRLWKSADIKECMYGRVWNERVQQLKSVLMEEYKEINPFSLMEISCIPPKSLR